VKLSGVPETALWTLYHRAVEARRPGGLLRDPYAVELVERIDFPFEEMFGRGQAAQLQALRVLTFDREIRRFLKAWPGGTVVALGEGLETQSWRVDNGQMQWVTVDLPEMIEVRTELLPARTRRRMVAASALDPVWMEGLDPSQGVLVTAQGLLMYLPPEEVEGFFVDCRERLGGATMLFDAIPPWIARLSVEGRFKTRSYTPPPWPWGLSVEQARALGARVVRPPRAHGLLYGVVLPLVHRLPALPNVYRVSF
jgi:O-methyltransferase involved in polyketide biosynthesis